MEPDFLKITKTQTTPFFVYDFNDIRERTKKLKQLLPEVKLYFSLKANPNPQLLELMRSEISGLDVSSGGEMKLALKHGYTGEMLSYAAPGKSESELKLAIQNNCGALSIESLPELEMVTLLARSLKTKANIMLRVNPKLLIPQFLIKMGGRPSQFGFSEDNIPVILQYVGSQPEHLNFLGYHFYAGTQCLSASALLRYYEYCLDLVKMLSRKFNTRIKIVNLGGGFGIPYNKEEPLKISAVAEGLAKLRTDYQKNANYLPEIVIELGRYLVAEAGYYVVKILNTKESYGKKFAIMDGGLNHLLLAYGYTGQAVRKPFIPINISNPHGKLENITITGPLCTPLDTLCENLEMNEVRDGDYLLFKNCGAYGLSFSPQQFLVRELPAEIIVQ